MDNFSITILGSSSSLPTAKRNLSSQVVDIRGHLFLVDCGEGTQLQLRRHRFKIQRIDHIFISHLHGDHYYGLIGLVSTMNMLGRTSELHIYCSSQLQEVIEMQLKVSDTKLRYLLTFHYLNFASGELLFENEAVTVQSIVLKHRIPCSGFLFKEKKKEKNLRKGVIEKYTIPLLEIEQIKKGSDFILNGGQVIPNNELTFPLKTPRSYAYCSDTAYSESIVEEINGVDLLYHESTFMENKRERARETYHSTTLDAANIAKKALVKQLIIGHFSARYKDLEPLLIEARTVFENTELAEDGKSFEVSVGALSYDN